jgi:tetratricopeptide (TPR) repeat protein
MTKKAPLCHEIWRGTAGARSAQLQSALAPHLEHVRELLLEPALAYSQEFLKENADNAAMGGEVGMAHRRVGDLYHYLERHAKAEQSFTRGIELLERLAVEFPGEPAYRQELARTFRSRAKLLEHLGRIAEAEKDVRRAAELHERLAADHPGEPNHRHGLVQSYNTLGLLLRRLRRSWRRRTAGPWTTSRSWRPTSPTCRTIRAGWGAR